MAAESKVLKIAFLYKINQYRKRRRRNVYIRPLFQSRVNRGESYLIKDLKNDPEYHHRYFRMNKECFESLLMLVGPRIVKQKNHAYPICEQDRLALTLRYLAAGSSQISLGLSYRISPSTVSRMLRETLTAICDSLEEKYLPPPNAKTFEDAAKDFENLWHFPHACGSLDGKHIRIKSPKRSGSINFNYKKFHSKVLFAVADAKYRFMLVDIGREGSASDGGILKSSPIKTFVEKAESFLPPPALLKNGQTAPFVFLGDEAFQLQEHLLKPYSGKWIEKDCRVFNYRLSRARLVVENSFGILAARWRILHTCIEADEDLITLIIKACVILHNYLMSLNDFNGITVDRDDENGFTKGNWRDPKEKKSSDEKICQASNNYSRDAFAVRETFKNYFMSAEGSIPWQIQRAFQD